MNKLKVEAKVGKLNVCLNLLRLFRVTIALMKGYHLKLQLFKSETAINVAFINFKLKIHLLPELDITKF